MNARIKSQPLETPKSSWVRLGYVPLVDAAPLIAAQELGYFIKYGLQVKLSAEAGWASIRDKIIFNELDAAHSLAALPFVTTAGLGCVAHPTVSAFVFNLHGNCITLSNRLRERGITEVVSLGKAVQENTPKKHFTFAVSFPYSTQAYHLRKWLRSGGINPDKDVRIILLPANQMFSYLSEEKIDGYCASEPWNSKAIFHEIGWCPVISADLSPSHPEKVLMTRSSFARQHEKEHLALVAALIDGARFCDQLRHRPLLIEILSQPQYLNVPAQVLENSLQNRFYCGHDQYRERDDFILFHRFNTNEPTPEKAQRILEQIKACGSLKPGERLNDSLINHVFDPLLYHKALQMTSSHLEED